MATKLPVSTLQRPSKSVLGIGYEVLIDSQMTNGAYEIIRFVVPPQAGPPPHIHRREAESFYVQEGEIEVLLGDQTLRLKAGDTAHLPPDQPHAFRNPGTETASMLVWVVPGNLQPFFEGFDCVWPEGQAAPNPVCPEDIGRLMVAAKLAEIEILGAK